jgi:acetoin:2,6-dichlorophenolindophenol oxidoreductase subunit beta
LVELTFTEALDAAVVQEMERDDSVMLMGTRVPGQIEDRFGPRRVRRMPIAESAMVGMAVGAAGSGMRPIVAWNNISFSFVSFDQVVNQAARIQYMFGGQRAFPIVFRGTYANGTRSAAQHSQTAYALYAHAGGLKIAVPSSPADAKGLLLAAIRDDNPVIVCEAARLADVRGEVGDEPIPLGVAALRRAGTDVTVVAIGYMVQVALDAAERAAADGVSAEVIDPRTLVPLDVETLRASVRRTGRLVVVDESHPTCSIASEIISVMAEDAETFHAMQAPAIRICTAAVPVPFSPPLEDFVLPGVGEVQAALMRAAGAGSGVLS